MTTTVPVPTLGRIVLYRTDGRNGLAYDLPAVVQCTWETHPGDYPDGSHNPLPVPMSPAHVHLTVLTPGGFGTRVAEADELPASEDFVGADLIVPGSGTYVEWDVPHAAVATPTWPDQPEPPARSWRWPERDTRTMKLTPAEDVWAVELEDGLERRGDRD